MIDQGRVVGQDRIHIDELQKGVHKFPVFSRSPQYPGTRAIRGKELVTFRAHALQ
jgi:hypothetical protein